MLACKKLLIFINSYGDSHDRVSFAYEVMACSAYVSATFESSESASVLELLNAHKPHNLGNFTPNSC